MAEQWLEEFLYRGRPPSGSDADKEPSFHIVIGTQYDHPARPGEKIREFSDALTMDQAKELGFDVEEIFKGFSATAVKDARERAERITELEDELANSKMQHTNALADKDREIADIMAETKSVLETSAKRIAELEKQSADLDTAHREMCARVASATKVLTG